VPVNAQDARRARQRASVLVNRPAICGLSEGGCEPFADVVAAEPGDACLSD